MYCVIKTNAQQAIAPHIRTYCLDTTIAQLIRPKPSRAKTIWLAFINLIPSVRRYAKRY